MPTYTAREADGTQKVRTVVQSELKTVKRLQFWISIGLMVAGLGFGAAMYLTGHYASVTAVTQLSDKHEELLQKLNDHIQNETARMAAIEQLSKNVEEDFHWQRAQLSEITRATRALPVPPPHH